MEGVTLASPRWLYSLLPVLALALGYWWRSRRRTRYAVRLAATELLATVMPRSPRWRRHVPAALLLAAAVALSIGLANPVHQTQGPPQHSILVLALDVSPSMEATDVPPDRFRAMQSAVRQFVGTLPDQVFVGLVSFAGTATINVLPTTDHQRVIAAVNALQLRSFTSLKDAVLTSLSAIGDSARPQLPAGMVLLSDGGVGNAALNKALDRARSARIPISTVALGTPRGVVHLSGGTLKVPVDTTELDHIAAVTGGLSAHAATPQDLTMIYQRIAHTLDHTMVQQSLRAWLIGAALVLTLMAAALSLAWFAGIP